MNNKVKIFDTTLRDGEQAPGCSMHLDEKLAIAKQLEKLGVDIIEAGFAVSSHGDFKSVKTIADTIKNCTVASLSRSVKGDIDASYEALKGAASPRIHLFLATSPIHMEYKLKKNPDEVLEMAVEMVKYAKRYCSDVEFSAEDATRSELPFLAKIVSGVINAGATTVNIPDTVGYTTPNEMGQRIDYLMKNVDNIDRATISVHCHNDLGMGVANSLAGVYAGARQIECSVNGIGERAGNAALEELIMALRTRHDYYKLETSIDTTQIYRTSKLVYATIGQQTPINKAIVGPNAFAHESGIHQHGVMANKETYEIMTPESVGIKTNTMVLGKHSGRHAFLNRLQELGYHFTAVEVDHYFDKFKELCDKKKVVTDNDLEALISNKNGGVVGYSLKQFYAHSSNNATSTCVISLEKDDEVIEEVAKGDGPVDAAFNAIDKMMKIGEYHLDDYSIHSVSEGKDAQGEVVVKLRMGEKSVLGRGLSTDILESSILAYLNGINKLLS